MHALFVHTIQGYMLRSCTPYIPLPQSRKLSFPSSSSSAVCAVGAIHSCHETAVVHAACHHDLQHALRVGADGEAGRIKGNQNNALSIILGSKFPRSSAFLSYHLGTPRQRQVQSASRRVILLLLW